MNIITGRLSEIRSARRNYSPGGRLGFRIQRREPKQNDGGRPNDWAVLEFARTNDTSQVLFASSPEISGLDEVGVLKQVGAATLGCDSSLGTSKVFSD